MKGNSDLRQRDIRPENGKASDVINEYEEPVKRRSKAGKIVQIQESCTICCIPCLTSHNPLPENPSRFQRFKHAFMLPLHGHLASYIQFAVVCVQLWIVLYTLTHGQAMPGGNFFSLLILFIGCAIGGYFISFLRLPPLLGMLIVGLLLNNVPVIKIIGENIDNNWSKALRKFALTVILTRAGLGLDIVKLKKLSWAVLRLAFLPCAAEIIVDSIVAHFVLGFPWQWSIMLGCILGALSPAVTVPALVNLQDRRYGVAKGIPTMLLAAGGLDNVFCVTGFSVFFGIIFSKGDLAVTIVKGPLGVFVGIVYGFVAGVFLWYIPSKDCTNKVFYRSLLLIGFGMIAIFGSSEIELSGAGPLGCLTTATVAGYKWRQRRHPGEPDEVSGVMALVWLIAQHFLFGLIGTAVNISNIQASYVGWGVLTLAIGLLVRSVVDFLVTLRTGFNLKERVFITLTWLSKATVQAAIGRWALDEVTKSDNPDAESLKYATDVLTLSVLAIIICAPTGATLMALLGPRFLVKGDADETLEVKSDSKKKDHTRIEMFDIVKPTSASEEMTEIPLEYTNEFKEAIDPKEIVEAPVDDLIKNTNNEGFGSDTTEVYTAPPETYKSQLIVTLSNSESKDTDCIIHSNMLREMQSSGIDNPVFDDEESLTKDETSNLGKENVNISKEMLPISDVEEPPLSVLSNENTVITDDDKCAMNSSEEEIPTDTFNITTADSDKDVPVVLDACAIKDISADIDILPNETPPVNVDISTNTDAITTQEASVNINTLTNTDTRTSISDTCSTNMDTCTNTDTCANVIDNKINVIDTNTDLLVDIKDDILSENILSENIEKHTNDHELVNADLSGDIQHMENDIDIKYRKNIHENDETVISIERSKF